MPTESQLQHRESAGGAARRTHRLGPQMWRTDPSVREHAGWGPVWAGVTVTVATIAFLQLTFFALGWLNVDATATGDAAGPSSYVMGVLAGIVGFLAGGFTAGATAAWRGVGHGPIHGFVAWTTAVVVLAALSLFGAGRLFGAVSDALARVSVAGTAIDPTGVAVSAEVIQDLRQAAAWATGSLVVFLLCSVAGAVAGSRAWPQDQPGAR